MMKYWLYFKFLLLFLVIEYLYICFMFRYISWNIKVSIGEYFRKYFRKYLGDFLGDFLGELNGIIYVLNDVGCDLGSICSFLSFRYSMYVVFYK